MCVVNKKVDGAEVQELSVFKKGIKVNKNEKGVTCGDLCLALVSCVLFVVYFICVPFYLAELDTSILRGDSDGSFIAAAVFVWIVWMCMARFCSDTASYIGNMQDFVEALENIDLCIKSPPSVHWHMESYHYETRTRTVTDGEGNTRTETY